MSKSKFLERWGYNKQGQGRIYLRYKREGRSARVVSFILEI